MKFLQNIFRKGRGADFWAELEESLLAADVGVEVTGQLIAAAREEKSPDAVRGALARRMIEILTPAVRAELVEARTVRPSTGSGRAESKPRVILVVGVNGAGKTTTIAKLARRSLREGRRVLLVAADTFRAAAVEQLGAWGQRLGAEVVAQGPGADAAAVAFDGVAKAAARGIDVVLIDTAGRLHTKANLMEELKKIARVAGKALPGAPHERWLVIDATVGGNGLAQAREFHGAMGLTGVVAAKLDGTAKGGVLLAIAGELGIPITHVGVGEGMDDLKPFDPEAFVSSIVG